MVFLRLEFYALGIVLGCGRRAGRSGRQEVGARLFDDFDAEGGDELGCVADIMRKERVYVRPTSLRRLLGSGKPFCIKVL